MSLHNMSRSYALVVALAALPLMAACSLSPVYGDRGISTEQSLLLNYAAPSSRNDQIFYQTLSQRLGIAQSADAPSLNVSLSINTPRIGLSNTGGPENYQVVVTANYVVTDNAMVIASGTRVATGGYRTSGQDFANDESRQTAIENAVAAVAEKVRLALLSQVIPK